MKKQLYSTSLSLLLLILATGCSVGSHKYLSFDLQSGNHLAIDSLDEHHYRITTQGGDPYIMLKELNQSLVDGKTVLTFEYRAKKGINFLEVFFLTQETGSFGSNVAGSLKCPGLAPAEEMTLYSVDLGEAIANANWKPEKDLLRIDFGDQAEAEVLIRNMHFRKRNKAEDAFFKEKEAFKAFDKQQNDQFANYLSRTYPSSINRVEVLDSTIRIQGKADLNKDKAILYAVKPWENILKPEQFNGVEITQSPFTLELARYEEIDGFNYDHALSKWVITGKGGLLSSSRYADYINPQENMPKGVLNGRKGIGGYHIKRGYSSDLTDFPVTSITVNVGITRFMYLDKRENTIEHLFHGKHYYFDASTVEGYDQTMLQALKHNIIVAAIILVNPASQSVDPKVGELLQDDHFEGEHAFFTMPNMTSMESVHCYAAALDFLASRYSREDNKFGRIHHWIIHNEVDAGNVWTNMGKDRPLHVFLDAYHKSMRLCYNIARKYDAHSEVLASFTHSWAEPVPVDGDYSTLDLLNGLLRYSAVEGDFQWGLAYHPYPEDLNEPKTWNDKSATFTMNTPMITFKNLEVLDKWIKQPENFYLDSQKRTVWLSENGTNSRSYSEQDLAEQAAGFAYAWKKMKNLDGIDAFQWHNWMDGRGEFGLRIGLRKYPDDENDPAGKKPVWYLYQAADTPQEDKIFEPYKPIIGIRDWTEIMHKVE
ncbi:MAG TPA: hypothetical protein DDX07_00030 [Porphyromonadaceae bacterium]|jgi:hypothetical protein|nr:hypothetical protein [Porphyromonadaceae bacterium]